MGGFLPSAFDANGDGREELLNVAFILYGAYDGQTGIPVFPVKNLVNTVFPKWVSYSTPTIADFRGTGQYEVYLNSASYAGGAVAVIGLDAERKWWHPLENPQGFRSYSAVGDVDRDGMLEICAAHLDGRLVCYNGADGVIQWTESIPSGGTWDIAASDIDGDGAEEFITVIGGNNLVAYNGDTTRGESRVLWSLPLGSGGNHPVIADVDADSIAEILICTSDGYLRIYGVYVIETGFLHSRPADGATNVVRNTAVRLTFSTLMDTASVAAALSITPDAAFRSRWEANQLILEPDTLLAEETTYTVAVSGSAKDIWGIPFEKGNSVVFITGTSTKRARLVSINPRHNQLDVSPSTTIRIEYTGDLMPASIETAVTFEPDLVGKWLHVDGVSTFVPTNPLAFGRYKIDVGMTAAGPTGIPWEIGPIRIMGGPEFIVPGGLRQQYLFRFSPPALSPASPTTEFTFDINHGLDSALTAEIDWTSLAGDSSHEAFLVINGVDTVAAVEGFVGAWKSVCDGKLFQRGTNTVAIVLSPGSEGVSLFKFGVYIHFPTKPVSVGDGSASVPRTLTLRAPWPNPSNPSFRVDWGQPTVGVTEVTVFDVLGRPVAVLADGRHAAGWHTRMWQGRDVRGRRVGCGVYVVRVKTADAQVVRRISLVR
jgi:hypothetical protein